MIFLQGFPALSLGWISPVQSRALGAQRQESQENEEKEREREEAGTTTNVSTFFAGPERPRAALATFGGRRWCVCDPMNFLS